MTQAELRIKRLILKSLQEALVHPDEYIAVTIGVIAQVIARVVVTEDRQACLADVIETLNKEFAMVCDVVDLAAALDEDITRAERVH